MRPKPRKRQKTQTPVSDDEATAPFGDESEEEVAKPKSRATAPKKKVSPKPATDEPEASDVQEDLDAVKSSEIVRDDSESEMSVVMDDEPKPARTKSKSAETAAKKEKKPLPKANAKTRIRIRTKQRSKNYGWLCQMWNPQNVVA